MYITIDTKRLLPNLLFITPLFTKAQVLESSFMLDLSLIRLASLYNVFHCKCNITLQSWYLNTGTQAYIAKFP